MYTKVSDLFMFKDSALSESIQVGIYNGEGFSRYYFHDSVAINFVLVVIDKPEEPDDEIILHVSYSMLDGEAEISGHKKIYAADNKCAVNWLNEFLLECQKWGFGK